MAGNQEIWQTAINNFMQDKIKLKVFRGTQNAINHLEPEDGAIYFATDSKKIFLGTPITTALGTSVERILMSSTDGGSGSFGFVYAAASLNDGTLIKVNPEVDSIDNPGYYIKQEAFGFTLQPFPDPQNANLLIYKPVYTENAALPDENTLVFNSDGWIFRVVKQYGMEDKVLANLLSTGAGGSGGGGGSGAAVEDLYLTMGEGWGNGLTYIYGQDYELSFVGKADRDRQVQFYIYIKDEYNDIVISDGEEPEVWDSEKPYIFHTNTLPETSKLTIRISIDSNNSRMLNAYKPYAEFKNIKVVRMELQKDNTNDYYPIKTSSEINQNILLYYIPVGEDNLVTTLHVYLDDIEQPALNKVLKKTGESNPYNQTGSIILNGRELSHGAHTVKLQLSVSINNTEKYSNVLTYEIALAKDEETLPVIWTGNYNSTIINYENAYIPFMVYDPLKGKTLPAAVSLYRNGQLLSEVSVDYSVSEWAEWDISNAYEIGDNTFTIVCRGAKKDIEIFITSEGARDLSIAQAESLLINYTTAGRSNLEVKSKRNVWQETTGHFPTPATLTGFNWQSNGWKKDAVAANEIDNGTYLSLTNGASVSIPCPSLTLNNEHDYTIEARFRIKNVQKYSTLVQSLPLYFYEMDSYNEVPSDAEFDNSISYYTKRPDQDIYDKVLITEFDENETYYTRTPGPKSDKAALMSWILENNKVLIYDDYGSPLMDEKNIQKIYQTVDGVVCKWLVDNTYGLVLGSQEAYFRTPRGSVNVRYKEDEVINISVVISKTDKLVYIYLNGILSGADALPEVGTGKIIINSPFVFNSDYCDIDLYRFRIFQHGLTMPDVIHNYLSDIHSVVLFDQNLLTTVYDPTQISYPMLVEYNENHPDALTMPYATWKIISREDEKLPWKKGDNQMCVVTFVNPSLDKALENHEIDEWYYYTHCPSFEAVGVDINVQGTSSQIYPRRNYKTKFKSAAASDKTPNYYWKYTKGSLAGKVVNKAYTVLDKDGNEHTVSKNFHMDNYGIGTNKFTWKIDYMESSGSYNTGFANLMGNNKFPLYTKHPLDDLGLDGSNLRSTVYGFPVLVFHEYADATKNPSNSAVKYEYIGRYNFNLDKSSNEYYGFESSSPQPYMTKTRYVEVGEDEEFDENTTYYINNEDEYEEVDISGFEPETIYYVLETYHPAIKDIAECWELQDNQGTWCSFKYPSASAREQGFGTPQGNVLPDSERLEMFKHFEYRYSPYGDQLDAIGADGKYDGTVPADKQWIADEIGTDDASKSEYARRVYSNLEVLFNWLDSTDATSATNSALTTPITYRTRINYMICLVQTNEVDSEGHYITEQWYCDSSNQPIVKTNDPGITTDENGFYVYMDNDQNLLEQAIAADDYEGLTLAKSGVKVTYTHDTTAYRLDKFRNEFDKHLDKEYCLVYFVLTELLLCYDSRGKNMMLSSYGPHEVGGDYIWYPMFYDIDTQLGLNNSGAYLWDYDADVTEEGLFSTPSSALWVNFYHIFKEDIKNKYRVLRGLDDNSAVHGSLTYDNIAGAYECNPNVFDSYAMRGIRPIIAIGLDEYYKYFATTKTGYFDTSGTKIIEDTPQYAYACQGDKKLTTELLLRNRLNYIDSWWLGGAYDISSVKQGQFVGRVNGNRFDKTSDHYLNLSNDDIGRLALTDSKYGPDKFEHADYPKAYLDARPGFQIKPFLKQYVSYFTDDNPSVPVKYIASQEQADGVWTSASESVITTYKTTAEMPNEQLTYIPGVDYLSSLGDLSTSYFSEFSLTAGKRLLDLTLGSDIPGYENSLIDSSKRFEIKDGKESSTKKALLKKIVMTGMKAFDKTLDVSGSEKLQEFRALDTALPNVYLADGAPLHTIHLPQSIQTLKLVDADNLTNILTSKPEVFKQYDNDVAEFYPPEHYRGLYIEGITDYTAGQHPGHKLSQLIIERGGLGYASYTLLENLVEVKRGASENSTCSISLKDVYWCPYEQVQYGESYVDATSYFIVTDHNTFDSYTYTNATDWDFDTLNGLIYTYNSNADKSIIQTTALLDNFIDWYLNESNQFTDTSDAPLSVPTITGTVFIANSNGAAIDEGRLTSYYEQYYPSLTIYAENVNQSNVTKYVNILDSGKMEVIDIRRGDGEHPQMVTKEHPTKTNYDFKGWADKDGNLIVAYDGTDYVNAEASLNTLSFSQENNVITLYAKFEDHAYHMRFYNADNILIEDVGYIYSVENGVVPTAQIPSYTDNALELKEVYKWLGWARKGDSSSQLINVSTLHPTNDLDFIAVYEKTSVYNNILDTKYLLISNNFQNDGIIGLNPNYYLTGKITLPTMINGFPVKQLGSDSDSTYRFSYNNVPNSITHIFFAEDNRQIERISNGCFDNNSGLVYFEALPSCAEIGSQAFYQCSNLDLDCLYEIINYAEVVGGNAFYRVGRNSVTIPGKSFTALSNEAFAGWGYASELSIGDGEHPTGMIAQIGTAFNDDAGLCSYLGSMTTLTSINIYISNVYSSNEYKDSFLIALGLAARAGIVTWHIIDTE